LSVELCACAVVHNDCCWNCGIFCSLLWLSVELR